METHQDLLNPLVSFRKRVGLSRREFAAALGLSLHLVIQYELGIPHHLHPRYLRTFPDILDLIPAYHAFRVATRQANFLPEGVVPENGPDFAEWLRETGLDAEEFSVLACMPLTDIHYALHHWRLPVTIAKFFQEVNENAR